EKRCNKARALRPQRVRQRRILSWLPTYLKIIFGRSCSPGCSGKRGRKSIPRSVPVLAVLRAAMQLQPSSLPPVGLARFTGALVFGSAFGFGLVLGTFSQKLPEQVWR